MNTIGYSFEVREDLNQKIIRVAAIKNVPTLKIIQWGLLFYCDVILFLFHNPGLKIAFVDKEDKVKNTITFKEE